MTVVPLNGKLGMGRDDDAGGQKNFRGFEFLRFAALVLHGDRTGAFE